MKRAIAACAALLLLPAFCSAQGGGSLERPSVFDDYLVAPSNNALFSIPGLSFQSSAGFSYFSGGGGFESFGMGYYMGHFGLRLAKNLTLRWDIGVGTVTRDASEYSEPQFFVPNVDLTYRPSENISLRFEFHQYRWPGYYNYRR